MSEKKSIAKSIIFEQSKKIYLTIVGLIFTYIIANYLGPEGYGEVIYLMSLTGSIQSLFGITLFESIIFVFVNRFKSKKIFDKLLKYQFLLNIVLVILLLLFANIILTFVNQQNIFLFRMSALLLVFMSIYMSFVSLCQAFKSFGKLFKAQSLMQTLELILAVVLIIFLGTGNIGVIIAQLIAVILTILLMYSYYLKFNYTLKKVDYKKEIISYVRPTFPAYFIRRIKNFVSLIAIGIYSNPLLMGYYYFAEKLIGTILGKTESTILDVLQSYVIEKWEDSKILQHYISMTIKISLIFSSIIGGFTLIASWFFLLMVMPAYIDSFSLIILFVLSHIFSSIVFIDRAFIALNKAGFILRARAFSLIIYLPLLFYSALTYSIHGIILARIIDAIVLGLFLYYYSRKCGLHITIIPTLNDFKYFIRLIRFKKMKNIGEEIVGGIKK